MSRYIEASPVADSIPFSDPSFISDNVRDGIVEAKQNAEGFPRAGIRSTYNGTISGNQWLGPSELLPNTPLVTLPVKTRINEITWANSTISVSFRIQFRKNSKTNPIVYTLTVVSPNNGYGFTSNVNIDLLPGETLYAQYLDDGTNCSDLDLVLWISRIP